MYATVFTLNNHIGLHHYDTFPHNKTEVCSFVLKWLLRPIAQTSYTFGLRGRYDQPNAGWLAFSGR